MDYILCICLIPAFPPVSFTQLEISPISLTIPYFLLIIPSSLSSLISSTPLNCTLIPPMLYIYHLCSCSLLSLSCLYLLSSSYFHLPPLSIGPLPPSEDYTFLSSMQSIFSKDTLTALAPVYSYDTSLHVLAYKPVAKKVHSVVTPVDELHITYSLLDNPLARLSDLPFHLSNSIPGNHFTQEHADKLDLNPINWLVHVSYPQNYAKFNSRSLLSHPPTSEHFCPSSSQSFLDFSLYSSSFCSLYL